MLQKLWRALPVPPATRMRMAPIFGRILARRARHQLAGPLQPDRLQPGPLMLSAFLSDVTGIGRAGRMTLAALQGWGVPVITHDLRKDRAGHALPETAGGIWICHCNPPQVLELVNHDTEHVWADRYRIGYWAYELPELPPEWLPVLRFFHEIWVPSRFVADAVERAGSTPIVRIVPHPVPRPLAIAPDRARFGFGTGFVFLTMFDARSSADRKNPIGSIRAFQRAFGREQGGVEMLVKIVAPESDRAGVTRLEEAAAGWPNIRFMTEPLSDTDVLQLISSADCLVSLHRAEGFGLPIAEAMLLGTPVIATAWSGNMQFCAGGIYEVDFTLVPANDATGRYAGTGQSWAEPSIESAVSAMRSVHGDADARAALIERAKHLAAERLPATLDLEPYRRFLSGL